MPTPNGLALLRGGGRPVEPNSTVRTTSCSHDDVLVRRVHLPFKDAISPSDSVLSRARKAVFSEPAMVMSDPMRPIPCEVVDGPLGPSPLGRLSFDSGVHALDLGFQAADFVLEFEDAFDTGDVDSGVGQGGYLA